MRLRTTVGLLVLSVGLVTPAAADTTTPFTGATTVFGYADLMRWLPDGRLRHSGHATVLAQLPSAVGSGADTQVRGWYVLRVIDYDAADPWRVTSGTLAEGQLQLSPKHERATLNVSMPEGDAVALTFEKLEFFVPTFVSALSADLSRDRRHTIVATMTAPRPMRLTGTIGDALVRSHPFDEAYLAPAAWGYVRSSDPPPADAGGDGVVITREAGGRTFTSVRQRTVEPEPSQARASADYTLSPGLFPNPCRATAIYSYEKEKTSLLSLFDVPECARAFELSTPFRTATTDSGLTRWDPVTDQETTVEDEARCLPDELCASRVSMPNPQAGTHQYAVGYGTSAVGGDSDYSVAFGASAGIGWFTCSRAYAAARCL